MDTIYRELYRAHYVDLLRAARQDRLVREALAAQPPAPRPAWQARVLAWWGERLIDWGERMQAAACAECA